jgi:hypothetical protein
VIGDPPGEGLTRDGPWDTAIVRLRDGSTVHVIEEIDGRKRVWQEYPDGSHDRAEWIGA